MNDFLLYLWDVRSLVLVVVGVAIGLLIARTMVKESPQVEFDDYKDMVDLQGFWQKFGGDK